MSITQNIHDRKLFYNNFNLRHTHDTSGRIGKLIPVQATPVTAGDLFDESLEFNIRFAPLSAPAMARFNVHFHAFYVPYRILTPRNGQETTWEKHVMSVGQPLTDVPQLPCFYTSYPHLIDDLPDKEGGFDDGCEAPLREHFMTGSLWDYLKLPIIPNNYPDDAVFDINPDELGVPGIIAFNFLAYLKIWNDWYRRDQIEEEVVFPLNLGRMDLVDFFGGSDYVEPENPKNVDTPFKISTFIHNLLTLRTRNYERDYFTSALPEPQFGDDVYLTGDSLQGLVGSRISIDALNTTGIYGISNAVSSDHIIGLGFRDPDNTAWLTYGNANVPNTGHEVVFYPNDDQQAITHVGLGAFDVTGIDGVTPTSLFTINELRLAMQLQGVRESINRGGTRYVEIMKSIHGVSVSDLRLQRPQYLGGIKSPISIGAVLQTSASTEDSPQGNMTGQGGTVGGNNLFRTKRIFEEDGVVMTVMSITPRTGYFGGIERQYLKHDPMDYFVPAFDRLGEQETYRAELKFNIWKSAEAGVNNDSLLDDKFLGYNPRYEEYKAAYSTVTGEFRNTLDNWNVFRTFDRAPVLSPDFIHAEPEDFDRIFMFENVESTSNEHFYAQIYFDIKAKRPMSKYSTPITLF